MITHIKRIAIIALVFCILSACSSESKEIISRKTNNDMEVRVDKYLKDKKFNGSILMAKEGDIWISKGYGMANFEKGIPNTPTTRFRIGSVTKQFTSLSIMKLQEQGLVNVKDTLNRYIPDYPNGDQITLHHLLSHTSGIQEYLSTYLLSSPLFQQYTSPYELINTFKQEPLKFTPGTQFSYSNSNYVLLGYIIEKVSKESYTDYINNNILRPLHMLDSGYDNNIYNEDNHAKGYEGTVEEHSDPFYNIDMSLAFSAGALYSTVEDLYLWDQALYTNKLITAASLDTMFTPKIVVEKDVASYAYGWFVFAGPENLVGHGGNIFGYSSVILKNRETKNVVIVLCNFDSYADISNIARDLNNMLDDYIK
ncbi:serine hydrolase domain-containing protein [Paenibacillus wynnii]|uniref:Beta-lactamase-related domain-containing protein n=1 Tax=Paenibacillus wynnii TaxID=268407 RepID=A0A098M4T4_9BACL|nr:serine hydrolase domain-containing protein [Paenibacillus wynnii]KGE17043.1 hypothetical protein PWYN_20510 [Paenibacillus wynnii]